MARQALKAIKNYHEFQHINIRAVMLKKDGQEIPVEIIGKLLLDKNGLPKGFQGTTRDVTARARAEEQVERHLIQLQALREIERTINSTLEADQILNIMMTELEQVVPYDSISVQMLEGDCLRIAACRGLTHAKEIKETLSFPLLPRFPNSQVIEKQVPVTFADITREYPHFMEEEYTTVMGHVRSWLGIPLVVKGESIGMFTLDRYQVRPFTEDEVQAAQSFANRAAIALENARLFSESQRRADEFRTLYEIGQDLSAEQELTHLLNTIATKAKELLAVEISWVYLHDPKRDDLQMAAIEGQVNGYDETVGARMDVGKGVVGRVAQDREMLIIEDYRVWEKHQPKYVQADFTSILSVPMLYSGELVGVLVVSDVAPKVREFTQDEIEILSLFATSAAGAVHSARLFNETQQRLNQLQSLRTIDKAISGVLDRDLMLRILLSQIVTQLEADAACVLIYNPHLYLLEYAVGQGFKSDLSGHITLRLGEGYAGQAAMQRQIIQIENVDEQKPRFLESPHLEGEDFHTYFGLPLIAKGQLTGVLEVFHRSPFQPDQDWLDYLDTLAGQVAIAIDNINMFRNLQQAHQELDLAYDQTLKGWAHALEYRDMETEGHSRRVTDMTVSLARTLGMQGKKLIQVRRGALLHDIGKMAVPDDILQKPGSLDDREWQIMRQHPVYAYEMLKSIDYLYPALDIPHCHHEKWDGSGYPRGLKGEQIPLAARIFAVVDVWDALTSDRPYREAWPEQKALNHIRQQAGKHFDPQVVDKFFETLQTHQD
jgi:putative nucleotidyltransferase with HDIG domain